jgi:hypothetical protein
LLDTGGRVDARRQAQQHHGISVFADWRDVDPVHDAPMTKPAKSFFRWGVVKWLPFHGWKKLSQKLCFEIA